MTKDGLNRSGRGRKRPNRGEIAQSDADRSVATRFNKNIEK